MLPQRRMLPRLALVLGLASSTLGSGCAQNLMQCTPAMPGGSCASSDDTEGKEVAAAIVGGVLLIAMIKMATEIVPLVMYCCARSRRLRGRDDQPRIARRSAALATSRSTIAFATG